MDTVLSVGTRGQMRHPGYEGRKSEALRNPGSCQLSSGAFSDVSASCSTTAAFVFFCPQPNTLSLILAALLNDTGQSNFLTLFLNAGEERLDLAKNDDDNDDYDDGGVSGADGCFYFLFTMGNSL